MQRTGPRCPPPAGLPGAGGGAREGRVGAARGGGHVSAPGPRAFHPSGAAATVTKYWLAWPQRRRGRGVGGAALPLGSASSARGDSRNAGAHASPRGSRGDQWRSRQLMKIPFPLTPINSARLLDREGVFGSEHDVDCAGSHHDRSAPAVTAVRHGRSITYALIIYYYTYALQNMSLRTLLVGL